MRSNRQLPRMIQILVLIFAALLSFPHHTQCHAQDVMERLKECDIESVSFDVPSIVHFDLSILEESPNTKGIRSSRDLGRTIRLSESQLRTEYL